jgi:hypothetical protein
MVEKPVAWTEYKLESGNNQIEKYAPILLRVSSAPSANPRQPLSGSFLIPRIALSKPFIQQLLLIARDVVVAREKSETVETERPR